MGKSDFQTRLDRLAQTSPAGSETAAHQAMLTHEIETQRAKRTAQARELEDHEDGGIFPASIWLNALLAVSSGALIFVHAKDPEQATKAAFIMVPIMIVIAFVLFYRAFKTDKIDALFDLFDDGIPLVRTLARILR